MRRLWNGMLIAFALYSKIPVPQADWSDENRRYSMMFFPWIGAVIGVCEYLAWIAFDRLAGNGFVFTDTFRRVIFLLIPVVVSGGIHLDGFLDTMDARSSWQEKERRLEILSDPHAGAFAIISGIVYFLFYYGVASMITIDVLPVICGGFALSRTLSGFAIVTFPKAKKTGLVATFSQAADEKKVRLVLVFTAVVLLAFFLWTGGMKGVIVYASAYLMLAYYYRMAMKYFGGITGDLAGYFLQICELTVALCAVVLALL